MWRTVSVGATFASCFVLFAGVASGQTGSASSTGLKARAKKKQAARGLDRIKSSLGISRLGDFHDLQESRRGTSSLVKAMVLNPRRVKGIHGAKLFTMNPFGDDFSSTQFERRSQLPPTPPPILLHPITTSAQLSHGRSTGTRRKLIKQAEVAKLAITGKMTTTELAKQYAAEKAAKAAAAAKLASAPKLGGDNAATSATRLGGFSGTSVPPKSPSLGLINSRVQPGQDAKNPSTARKGSGSGLPGRG